MSLTVVPTHARLPMESNPRIGDLVAELARGHAARMNDCAFAVALQARRVSRPQYVAFVATLYPSVVGFNRALIRSIAKVDHVRHSGFVKILAEQLQEEQEHNQMWRTKLEVFGVDHEALYGALGDYLGKFSADELDRRTHDFVVALTKHPEHTAPGCFPRSVFPESVVAFYHHLYMTAAHSAIDYWEHFAGQSAVEMMIWDVVSASVLPGVLGNPALDAGPATTQWWREHGKLDGEDSGVRTDEEKHLELSRVALNRSETANSLREAVATRAEDTMRLFAATMICQDVASVEFPVDRFLTRAAGARTGSRAGARAVRPPAALVG